MTSTMDDHPDRNPDHIDVALADLVDSENAAARARLWQQVQGILNAFQDGLEGVGVDRADLTGSDLTTRHSNELVELALTAIDALDRAHGDADPATGFGGIRDTVLVVAAYPDRLRLRGVLQLGYEVALARRNHGAVAAEQHLRGSLGAPTHRELASTTGELLFVLVMYAAVSTRSVEATWAKLAELCGQQPQR